MNASMLRALGRTIELCGFGLDTSVRSLHMTHDWEWEIVFPDGDIQVAYRGTLDECNELDSAYRAGSPTTNV
jgi:hypothetical protein